MHNRLCEKCRCDGACRRRTRDLIPILLGLISRPFQLLRRMLEIRVARRSIDTIQAARRIFADRGYNMTEVDRQRTSSGFDTTMSSRSVKLVDVDSLGSSIENWAQGSIFHSRQRLPFEAASSIRGSAPRPPWPSGLRSPCSLSAAAGHTRSAIFAAEGAPSQVT